MKEAERVKILYVGNDEHLLRIISTQLADAALYRELYRDVWQQEDLGDVRSLMVHVSNLRKKIDQDHTEMIVAVRGVGYLFQDA